MVVLSKCITTFVSSRAQAVRNIFCGFNRCAEQIRFQSELKLIKIKFKETIKLEHHWRQSRMTNGLKLLEMVSKVMGSFLKTYTDGSIQRNSSDLLIIID